MVLSLARGSGSHNEQFHRRVPADILKVARGKQVLISLPPETVGGTPIQVIVTLGDSLRFSLQTPDKGLGDRRRAAVIWVDVGVDDVAAGGRAKRQQVERN